MKKAQVKVTTIVIIAVLVVIAIVLIVITTILLTRPTTTGNIIKQNNPEPEVAYTPKTNTNNDVEILNQAVDYVRECNLNCPKECPSCEYLSFKCVESCTTFYKEKIKNMDFSGDKEISLLNDKNSKWFSCVLSCSNIYTNKDNTYVDYNCIHNC